MNISQSIENLVLKFIIFFFDSEANLVTETHNFHPILILHPDGRVGDTIMATGFYRELNKKYPYSYVYVLGNEQVKEVLEPLNFVKEVFIYEKSMMSTLRLFFKLRKRKFKFILNTTDGLKPHGAFLQGQLKACQKIIFNNDQLKSTTKIINFEEGQTHFTSFYENTLNYLFADDRFDMHYQVGVSLSAQQKAETLFEMFPGKKLVVFNAFSGSELGNFSYYNSMQIINHLLADPDKVVISVAGPANTETLLEWRERSLSMFSSDELARWPLLDEVQTLDETFALMEVADFIISVDTSLVHAACALDKKLICVYRQTGEYQNSCQWGPRWNRAHTIILHAPSTPPEVWDINDLSFEELKEAIDEMDGITGSWDASYRRDTLSEKGESRIS